MPEGHEAKDYTKLSPDMLVDPEQEEPLTDQEIVIDNKTGNIAHVGDPRDTRQWLEGEESRKGLLSVEEIQGGAAMPTMTEGHGHPGIYAAFGAAKPESLSNAESLEDVRQIIEKAKADKEEGEPIVILGWNTAKIPHITREQIDEVSGDSPVIIFDQSFHGAMGNTKAMEGYEKISKQHAGDEAAGTYDAKTGYVNSQQTFKMMELVSDYFPVESIAKELVADLETKLSSGVTAVHDMELTSFSLFKAYLKARQDWNEQKNVEFPITEIHVNPTLMERIVKEANSLVESGMFDFSEIPHIGIKLLADGSFGARTALMGERYDDKDELGLIYDQVGTLNRMVELAKKEGLSKLAVHGIGDAGIQRAVMFAQKWLEILENGEVSPQARIEHFELPLPLNETLARTKDLGIWVGAQPNFVLDEGPYKDRIGVDRIKMICPYQEVANAKIPMIFGTDGMPNSMLFAIWCATHAGEESQRMTFQQALLSASLTAGEWERSGRGKILEGKPADIMITDPKLVSTLTGGDGRVANQLGWDNTDQIVEELHSQIINVFKAGKKVR